METKATNIVVGAGGAGGWICALLAKSDPGRVVVVDADVVTEKNLDRQLFSEEDVGRNKAQAMAGFLSSRGVLAEARPEYLAPSGKLYDELRNIAEPVRLFSCPDNHPARMACLKLADDRAADGLPTAVAVAGNEYESASADAYFPQWRGTARDFRIRYPEVARDVRNDPLNPPCTGEILESEPQLALYNCLGALSAAWLMDAWTKTAEKYSKSDLFGGILAKMPVAIEWSAASVVVKRYGDFDA